MASSSQDLSALISRASVTVIPKDQQAILEQPHSWFADSHSADVPHVPDHVLQAATDAHIRTNSNQDVDATDRSTISTNAAVSHDVERGLPTQDRDLTSSARHANRSIETSGLKVLQHSQASVISETPRRLQAMGPPPKPSSETHVKRPLRGPPPSYDPVSSYPEEEELEIQVPQAHVLREAHSQQALDHTSSASTMNSSTLNTPPCAQPQQASFPSPEIEKFRQEPRRKKFKPLPPMEPSKTLSLASRSPELRASYSAMPSVPSRGPSRPSSLALHHPSSSDRQKERYSTMASQAKQKQLIGHISQRGGLQDEDAVSNLDLPQPLNSTPSRHTAFSASILEDEVNDADEEQEPTQSFDPGQVIPSTVDQSFPPHDTSRTRDKSSRPASRESLGRERIGQRLSDSSKAKSIHRADERLARASLDDTSSQRMEELQPFEQFTATYPSYAVEHSGTLWSFVRACICLDFLRQTNGLRDCLWDEFIRAFSADYLDYATGRPDPLPAIDWFNNLNGVPHFNSMVVKKSNIARVLSVYDEIVQEAKGFIKTASKTDSFGAQGQSRKTVAVSSEPKKSRTNTLRESVPALGDITTPEGRREESNVKRAHAVISTPNTPADVVSGGKKRRLEARDNNAASRAVPSTISPRNDPSTKLSDPEQRPTHVLAKVSQVTPSKWSYDERNENLRDPERASKMREFYRKSREHGLSRKSY